MRFNRGLKFIKLIVFLITVLLESCSPKVNSSNSGKNSYSEDLSGLLPTYQLEKKDTLVSEDDRKLQVANFNPQYDITDTLNAVLDSISTLSQSIKYVDGYAVQVYSGNNREAANIARGKAFTLLEDEKPELFYDAPNFKVHVGQFYTSLEANKTYADLKKEFPNAILVLKKFKIERE